MEQVEFKDFRIGELFKNPQRGTRLISQHRNPGKIPLITAGKENYGESVKISSVTQQLFSGENITIDMFGNVFFRDYDFYADDNIIILNESDYSKNSMLYITSVLSKTTFGQYSYSKQFRIKSLPSITISLPVTSSGAPNYSYMESYISYIEKLHVANIEKILKELGYNSLKDAELTADDKEILRLFSGGGLTTAEFKIGELFDTSLWKYSLQSQNFLSTSPVKTSTHDLAVVTGTVLNNSIAYYVNRDEVNESNIYSKTLTMTTRGQSGVVKFQEEEFLLHNNSLALCGVFEKLNKNKKVALYVMAVLNKLGYGNSYSNFPTVKTLSEDTIPLPINPQSPTIPHYSLMESYITAIEKLHVNKLISSHNQEITI